MSGGIRYATFLYVAVDQNLQTEESRVEITHDCNEPVRVKVTYAFMDAKLEFDPREGVKSGEEHRLSVFAVSNRSVCPTQENYERESSMLLSIRAKVTAWGARSPQVSKSSRNGEWGSFWVLFEELGTKEE